MRPRTNWLLATCTQAKRKVYDISESESPNTFADWSRLANFAAKSKKQKEILRSTERNYSHSLSKSMTCISLEAFLAASSLICGVDLIWGQVERFDGISKSFLGHEEVEW